MSFFQNSFQSNTIGKDFKNRSLLLRFLAIVSAFVLLISIYARCNEGVAEEGIKKTFDPVEHSAEPIRFQKQIQPIFASKCLRCHGPDEETREGGLRLDERAGALLEMDSGERAIVPGNIKLSHILERVATNDDSIRMPPKDAGEKLTSKEIALLKQWIQEGAKYEKHWAFIPPTRPAIPVKLSQPNWARNDLDRFVLSRLDHEKLAPAPEATKAVLIRRASLLLTGLPPSPQEVSDFEKDNSADAYEKVVDRLLASPTYGERWARVWLDLARYADSAGYAQDPARVIWRYRDWVIKAINENKPFDQFTIEQLAGDLLEKPTNDQLIATAFHRNTMTNSEGGTDDEEFRNAAVIDRVNTTMQVWMGLTMGCAQCHTHKYDPITQTEYFQVFAVFNSTADSDKQDESPNLVELLPSHLKQREQLQKRIVKQQKQIETKRASLPPPPKLKANSPLKTRYLRIQLPGSQKILSLAEVEAFVDAEASADRNDTKANAKTPKETNIAFRGKASQSSDYNNVSKASRAVDGTTNGDFPQKKSVSHTIREDNPWWEVDLKKSYQLKRVVIWNRTDGNVQQRLAGYRVIALDENRIPLWGYQSQTVPNPSQTILPSKNSNDLTADEKKLAHNFYLEEPPRLKKDFSTLKSLKRQLAAVKGVLTPIMREVDADKQRKTFIQIRGNFLSKGKEVQAGVLKAFHPYSPAASSKKVTSKNDALPTRLDFARWLVDEKNPLAARVVVNRHWEQLFGMGLVQTSEDFGIQGQPPVQPEVLDFLATELIRQKWDIKKLLRMIVTSATFRQSSRTLQQLSLRDPDNRLFARGPQFRLPAEMIRDNALAVSGLLSRKMNGPSVRPRRPNLGLKSAFGGSTDWKTSGGEDQYRRGLYTQWRRTTPYPSMTTFDAPSREVCTIRRIRTNTPLQALVTLNDPVYIEAAQALARRVLKEKKTETLEAKLTFAFRLCVARKPTSKELKRLVQAHGELSRKYRQQPDQAKIMATEPIGKAPEGCDMIDLAAWTAMGNILLNLDETLSIF